VDLGSGRLSAYGDGAKRASWEQEEEMVLCCTTHLLSRRRSFPLCEVDRQVFFMIVTPTLLHPVG
jgi:hypothetical protein